MPVRVVERRGLLAEEDLQTAEDAALDRRAGNLPVAPSAGLRLAMTDCVRTTLRRHAAQPNGFKTQHSVHLTGSGGLRL